MTLAPGRRSSRSAIQTQLKQQEKKVMYSRKTKEGDRLVHPLPAFSGCYLVASSRILSIWVARFSIFAPAESPVPIAK